MPTIKNGQYADITIIAAHINEKKDKLLKDKYYMKGERGYYIKHLGKKYYIAKDKDSERIITTGIIKNSWEQM